MFGKKHLKNYSFAPHVFDMEQNAHNVDQICAQLRKKP